MSENGKTTYERKRAWLSGMLLAAAIGLSGCGAPSEPAADAPVEPEVKAADIDEQQISGPWRVLAVLGEPLTGKAAPVKLALDVEQQRFTGHDGCNNFMGSLSLGEQDQLMFSGVASTKKGCPPGTTPAGFYRALDDVRSFRYQRSSLELMDANGAVVLSARRAPQKP